MSNREKRAGGRAAALVAKCVDCIYDDMATGTWRQQVEACPSTQCPLWPHRPVSLRTVRTNKLAKIA